MTDLTGTRPRNLAVWNGSPVRLERSSSFERTLTEHEVDCSQWECTYRSAPDPAATEHTHVTTVLSTGYSVLLNYHQLSTAEPFRLPPSSYLENKLAYNNESFWHLISQLSFPAIPRLLAFWWTLNILTLAFYGHHYILLCLYWLFVLQRCSCCVGNYTPVENHGMRITLVQNSEISAL